MIFFSIINNRGKNGYRYYKKQNYDFKRIEYA